MKETCDQCRTEQPFYRQDGMNFCLPCLKSRTRSTNMAASVERARHRYLVYTGKITPIHTDKLTAPPRSMAEADRWLAEHAH